VTPTLFALFGYLLLQFGIGAVIARRLRSEDDYLVAGRSLGWGLGTFTIFATWFGAETVIGAAGTVYDEGVGATSAEPFGYALCLLLMGLVFAVPLWRRGLTTLADLYAQRYSPTVARIAALVLVPGSLLWAAAQVRAFGQVLASTSATIDITLGVGVAALLTIAYTTLGGMLADAITDVIQGAVLAISLVVLLFAVGSDVGGAQALLDTVRTAAASRAPVEPAGWLALAETWAIPVCGSVVATELVTRVISTRSAHIARGSALLASGIYLLLGLVPVVLGLAGPVLVPGLADAEQLLPTLAQRHLPGVLYVLFAGGLVSAILSTVDTTLLTAGGLLTHNVAVPLLRITAPHQRLRVARVGVFACGVAAWAIASSAEGVFALVEEASSFGTAGGLVTVCFGLFTRFGGPWAAGTTLVGALAVYLGATYGGLATPFLASLASALLLYVAVGAWERSATTAAPADTGAGVSATGP
jgi:Na+/proline symporter